MERGVRNEEEQAIRSCLSEIFVASGLVPDVDQRCVRNVADELRRYEKSVANPVVNDVCRVMRWGRSHRCFKLIASY